MDDSKPVDNNALRDARAAAAIEDPETAALLAKHEAHKAGQGPKPTQREFGKIGAWFSKVGKNLGLGGQPEAPAQADRPVEAVEDAGGGLPPEPADAALCERISLSVLARTDSIARRKIGAAARRAGIDATNIARLERAAGMRDDDKKLVAEISPDALASVGISPRQYPLAVLGLVMLGWGTDLWMITQELKELQKPPAAGNAQNGAGGPGAASQPREVTAISPEAQRLMETKPEMPPNAPAPVWAGGTAPGADPKQK